MGWVFNATPRPLTPRRDPIPIVYEAGWALGPVWTGAENLAVTGIQSLDRPARSESLYRLSYPRWRHFSDTSTISILIINTREVHSSSPCVLFITIDEMGPVMSFLMSWEVPTQNEFFSEHEVSLNTTHCSILIVFYSLWKKKLIFHSSKYSN